ncbi:MAG: hypothetical protein GT597_13915 [Bacteroidales bacterium]|jgi:hypothetical protein|nr:hypothetical protein [Bacteroidales bacterium]
MARDYITLTDKRRVGIEWNMNALADYTAKTGKELTDLAVTKTNIRELRIIAHCAAIEGELADGRELGLTEEEFGRLMGMNAVIAFAQILKKQTMGSQSVAEKKEAEEKEAEKKRPAFLHLRRMG